MTRYSIASFAILALVLTGGLVQPIEVKAQSMTDYTATPPFTANATTPNVLIVMDNSGSMNRLAFEDTFNPPKSYTGLFDPSECYQYTTTAPARFVPDPAANPVTMPVSGWTCQGNNTYEWSGNLLNYVSMRRIDIVKLVLVGGICSTSRDADGICTAQVHAQDSFSACCQDQTQSIIIGQAQGRMPNSIIPSGGDNNGSVYFHMMGSKNALKGSFCVDNDSGQPNNSCDSDGGSYLETQYQIMLDAPPNSSGIVQETGDKARLGLMTFNSSNGGKILADVGQDMLTMVGAVETTVPATWTPLAESLYEASRYFAQIQPAYANTDFSYTVQDRDPYYFTAPRWASTADYVECCQSYVIIFTDGEPTKDANIPGNFVNDNGTPTADGDDFNDCPVGTGELCDYAHVVHGSHCTGAGCNGHRTDYPSQGTHYLDDVAYWAHIHDLRQGTIPVLSETGKDLQGFQNLNVYTFFAFGSGSDILQDAAKAGGFVDRNGNNIPDNGLDPAGPCVLNPQPGPCEYDEVDNLSGAAVPDGIPDTYFESANADDLRDRLLATISSILEQSASGTAASVLASSSSGEGAIYQSFFFPTTLEGLREVTWTGYTHGLFLDTFGNIREDTDGDAKLVYEDDRIVRARYDATLFQVMLDRFDDADGNGVADSGTPVGPSVSLRDALSIWEAGRRLAQTTPSARNIMTWIDQDNDGVVDNGEQIDFVSTAQISKDLEPYLRPGASPFTAKNIIDFIRGEQVTGLRDRQLTVGGALEVWKLGDTIHAQPLVVGSPTQRYDIIYGDPSYTTFFNQYKDRRRVAYVGANDGMLHAFNAGYYHRGDDPSTTKTEHGWFTRTPTDNSGGPLLGEELWGFIPQELLPHLKWLTQPDYTHVYYVDLTPKVTDVRIFTPDADHPNGWGTILMGGFRMGGSCGACVAGTGAPEMTVTADFDGKNGTPDTTRTFYSAYFVLDITNPEVDPKLLWSFSGSDLGLTTGVPSMLRVSPANDSVTDNTNAKWYMIVGSGPTGYDASVAQSTKLYAIDLDQGPGTNNSQVTTLPVGIWTGFMGDTLTIDRDFDYRVDVTYSGRVIHDGSLPWRGKLYRLTMNDCTGTPCSTNTWGVDNSGNRIPTEILDTFQDGGGSTQELGPIAAAPAVTIDDANKLWVFAGTGRYYDDIDKTNTDTQYFVGVKDSVLNGSCTESTRTSCQDDDLVDVSTAEVCVLGVDDCGSGTDQVTNVTGATDFPSLINLVASKDGWFTSLLPPTGPPQGERVLVRPLVFGGLVLFPTFTPTKDICASTGDSYLYALYYRTGSAYSAPVIGTTPKSGKEYVNRSTWIGEGMASAAVVHQGHGSSRGKATAYVQTSTGELTKVDLDGLPEPPTSRLLSWHDARD